jgi:small ligand-binding sensory domain FIST
VAVLAIQGLEAEACLIPDPAGEEEAAADEIVARLGEPRAEDLVVLFPDPGSFDSSALLPALTERLGPATLVGAGAGDPLAQAPLQWCGRSLASGAISALMLRGAAPPRVGVTQACRPVTELLSVTGARGHWILEIEGRPALEVFRQAAGGALADDLRRAAQFVLVAQPVPGAQGDPLAPGNYLVRHAIGMEEDANAFAIPAEVRPGDRIAFAFRDAAAAREDLKAMLARVADPAAACGIYLDCCARGSGFFGVQGLEAAYLDQALGGAPVAGMFGSFEIGPIGGTTELLSYTGVLALLEG